MKVKKLKDGTEINEQDFMTWLEYLYSGEYNQTKGTLQDSNGFCCLGVACEVLDFDKGRSKGFVNYGLLRGGLPIDQGKAPLWLKRISNDVYERSGELLHHLNDHSDMTFEEIADTLYAVYVLGILEE